MARRTQRRPSTANASDLHRQWLELVDTDGPFLAIAPLKRVWPQGMPSLNEDRKDALHYARKDFEAAWEALDRATDEGAVDAYRIACDKWVETVLRDVAGWAESLSWGQVPGVQAQSPNRAVTVTAQAALLGPDGDIGALISVVDPVDSLRQTPNDLWAATPIDRMEALLRENGIQIGIVTDGRWWGLVCARENAMAASGVVDSLTWVEEPRTRDAFLTVISRQYIVGGDANERLPVLFEQSVAAAEEITEALGAQVRRAVELLIQSFSESAVDATRVGERDPLPADTHETYEAAVTIMMRIVFLLFAEERGLLPSGELFEQGYGISRELDGLQGREAEESEEALDATSLTWHRLLATSQALYGGASFENMRVPAYGGSLFDAARFPFLTAATTNGNLAITVSDRVMLHALRSVQQAVLKNGEARRISFRDIDVEQIGYIYEGLLGYTAVTVDEAHLGLRGAAGEEPEIPLSVLEQLTQANANPRNLAEAIRKWVEEDQPSAKPQSAAAIAKGVGAGAEPNVVSALAQAVGDDLDLRESVLPWLGLMRLDLRGRPFVVLDGGLMVKETPSRKNAGAHYTPKSLAKEVVLHALEPLCYSPGPYQTADESRWKLKSSDDLLSLKVADIACGSGAFLVAAGGYLADRVVEAWTTENPANAHRRDLHLRAVREVVANCLYGADINDMAVEMCKLSLWLVSLDRDLPFSFVDDKIFLGNSLLGLTTLDQLRRLHIDPSRVPATTMIDFYDIDIDTIIRKAVDLRRNLASEIDEDNPARNSAAKRRQLAELHRTTADLRKIANGTIAAGLPLGGKPGRALDEAYENLRIAVKAAHPESGEPEPSHLDSIIDTGLTPTVATDYQRWRPLHWVVEAPDVIVEHGGFDAIIGNPPFLGGKKISGAMGSDIREFIVNVLAEGRKGEADLVGYFLLRAVSLLSAGGTFGLLASESLSEGESRRVVLDSMIDAGLTITAAVKRRKWPSTAQVHVSILWATKDSVADSAACWCSGQRVPAINSSLEPQSRVTGTPRKLMENMGQSFMGSILSGQGFVLDVDEYEQLMADDPDSAAVCRPYLGGATEINKSPIPGPAKYVIDFGDRSLQEASRYPGAMDRVRRLVKPQRDRSNKKQYRENWWKFAERGRGLYEALSTIDRTLVIVLTSDTLIPVQLSSDAVYSNSLGVIGLPDYGSLALLTSTIHQIWAMRWGSTLRNAVRYTTSDVFETFPRPEITSNLQSIGERLHNTRGEIMARRKFGLTAVYGLVNDPSIVDDPDIAALRHIQQEIDNATVLAYGWRGIALDHGFHTYRQLERWMVGPGARVEILDRLLEENHRRAALGAVTGNASLTGRPAKGLMEDEGTLFS